MKTKIIIPKLCKVGFNERSDTYSKLLGFIIYHDGKTWRQEKSWESWREKYISEEDFEIAKKSAFENAVKHSTENYYYNIKNPENNQYWTGQYGKMSLEEFLKSINLHDYNEYVFRLPQRCNNVNIKPIEFKNEPREGFVLNKKVGGESTGWNHRDTYCRIYDPLGFEFEISIPNLLYILENTNSIKGKGLEGKFVYGWGDKKVILIPESAPEYTEMLKFTANLAVKFSSKELKLGYSYLLKNQQVGTYMGMQIYHDGYGVPVKKEHTFAIAKSFASVPVSKVAKKISQDLEYSNLVDKMALDKTFNIPKITMLNIKDIKGFDFIDTCTVYTTNGKFFKPNYLERNFPNSYYRKDSSNFALLPNRSSSKAVKADTLKEITDNHELFVPAIKEGDAVLEPIVGVPDKNTHYIYIEKDGYYFPHYMSSYYNGDVSIQGLLVNTMYKGVPLSKINKQLWQIKTTA